MDATGLICLILAMVALCVIVYYTTVCFPLELNLRHNKAPSCPDMGPLLDNNEDLNGNHEEPIGERTRLVLEEPDSSAPKPEDLENQPSTSGKNSGLESPMKSVTFQMTPECASNIPSNEGSVVLPMEEEPSVPEGLKPILPDPHERPITSVTLLKNEAQSPRSGSESPHTIVLMLDSPQKAMSDSYEEDGLLVPRPQGPPQVSPQKVLNRQKSAPESYGSHPPKFNQRNPRQVQVLDHTYSLLQLGILSSDRPARPVVRPTLKSPHSDPGIEKDSKVFKFGSKHDQDKTSEFFGTKNDDEENSLSRLTNQSEETSKLVIGAKHAREETSEQPIKKAKLTYNEGPTRFSADEDVTSDNREIGWMINPPRNVSNVDNEHKTDAVEVEESQEINRIKEAFSCDESDDDDHNIDDCSSSEDVIPVNTVIRCKVPRTVVNVLIPTEENEKKNAEVLEGSVSDPDEEVEDSESSDPDTTEYNVQRGSNTPDPAVQEVLLDEVSCYSDEIGLTKCVSLPEEDSGSQSTKERTHQITDHPPTPTSDTTKSISSFSSNDNSLDEINTTPPISLIGSGTPPYTPSPGDEPNTSDLVIIQNPPSEELSPSYIELETHESQRRLSSTSSSLSDTSTSSTNGSYRIAEVVDGKNVEKKNSSPKLLDIKNLSNQL